MIKELECTSCGAPVRFAKGDTIARCEYCGSEILLDTKKTIHIVDEARVKQVELDQRKFEAEHQKYKDKTKARRRYNLLKGFVIFCFIAAVAYSTSGENKALLALFLFGIFGGIFLLPQMNPDKEEHIRKLEKSGVYVSRKSRAGTFIICFFVGVFGIHRFYVGKIGTGILWLFTGGLFGIGWVVDLISIAVGRFTDKDGNIIME